MKRIIILLAFLSAGFQLQAQDKTADSLSIVKQLDAMVSSWNRHDYADMENYISKDCEWVNIVGMWWKNAAEVKFAHQFYHDRMFKGTTLLKKAVKMSFLSKDIALVHFKSNVSSFQTPDGATVPAMDELATLIYIRENNKWLLRAGENVQINPGAQQFDPVKAMPGKK